MLKYAFLIVFCLFVGFSLGFISQGGHTRFFNDDGELLVPTRSAFFAEPQEPPLQKYAITRLETIPLKKSPIQLVEQLEDTTSYTSYLAQWTTLEKIMTGLVILPKPLNQEEPKSIILLRGYAPQESYTTGVGTKNAATAFAKQGYITISPDFFGYGGSDSEPVDTWQARFEKPLIVKELIDSLQTEGIVREATLPLTTDKIGIWAHSNGGQIAITTLQAFHLDLPTTLWAPVTAPFPYSVAFFSDEVADEGKEQRKWISLFEDSYNVFDFSLTQHLGRLEAPLQLHHGETDEAALISWSDTFVENVTNTHQATSAAELKEPYPIFYYRYKNTDHNMVPSWNTAIERDIHFFKKWL